MLPSGLRKPNTPCFAGFLPVISEGMAGTERGGIVLSNVAYTP